MQNFNFDDFSIEPSSFFLTLPYEDCATLGVFAPALFRLPDRVAVVRIKPGRIQQVGTAISAPRSYVESVCPEFLSAPNGTLFLLPSAPPRAPPAPCVITTSDTAAAAAAACAAPLVENAVYVTPACSFRVTTLASTPTVCFTHTIEWCTSHSAVAHNFISTPAPAPVFAGRTTELSTLLRGLGMFTSPNPRFDPPRGALIAGAEGSGRHTLAAKAAATLGVPVVPFDGADVSVAGFDAALASASAVAPSVLLFSNLDMACPNRHDIDTDEAHKQFIGHVLASLDSLHGGSTGVFVVGIAGDSGAVDAAMRRAGRLEIEIMLTTPQTRERHEMIAHLLGDLSSDDTKAIRASLTLREDDDIVDTLARRTPGLMPADLALLCRLVTADPSRAASALRSARPAAARAASTLVANTLPPAPTLETLRQTMPEAAQAAEQALVWPLTRYDDYAALGLAPPRGALVVGLPGAGKTCVAASIAQYMSDNNIGRHIMINGPELFSPYVGETEAKIRKVFENARKLAPCLVIIDNIDGLTPARSSGSHEVTIRVVATILTELDGMRGSAGLSVVATTSRPEAVDPAVFRPGRLDAIIALGPLAPQAAANAAAVLAGVGSVRQPDRHIVAGEVVAAVRRARARTGAGAGAELAEAVAEELMAAPMPDEMALASLELFVEKMGIELI